VHVPPFTPVYPASHWHQTERLLPLGENEFAGQSRQVLAAKAPTVVEYLPAPQPMQVLAAEAPTVGEYFPATQSVQLVAIEAPTVGEYFPAPQPIQVLAAEAPTMGEYFPAVQSEHTEPASEYMPAAQATQAVEVVDPDGEDVPALQSEHEEPASEYLPAEQATQAVQFVDRDGEDVPALQLEHEEAPTVGEYFPALQSEHTEPASEYVPAAQATQAVDVVDPDGEDVPSGQLSHGGVSGLAKRGTLHDPVKPVSTPTPSDLKVTLTKPVEDETPGLFRVCENLAISLPPVS
jgi:hypothetical protein